MSFSGWGGIRTHGTLARSAVFKTAALNRSATHPCCHGSSLTAGQRFIKRCHLGVVSQFEHQALKAYPAREVFDGGLPF